MLSSLLLLFACGKSTEVVIVDGSSNILPDINSTNNQTKVSSNLQDDFNKIVIGEPGNIHSLDPLFAQSSSELRTLSLIYDGLTDLDNTGNIIPAIAKKWTVTRDSLTYTFTINEHAFFHDDNRFNGGTGRSVNSSDVANVFKRMAQLQVPESAASLFMSIDGFKTFFLEQTKIKAPSKRVINSIKGIATPNDSTVVFRLAERDSNFLSNLAHPLASIYPSESLSQNNSPISKPIGSGPFYVAQQKPNTLILAAFDDAITSKNLPNRVDVVFGKKEEELYQDFAKGEVDALIEISPATFKQVTDSTGNLDAVFSTAFSLQSQEVTRPITLNYNVKSQNEDLYTFLTTQGSLLSAFDTRLGNISYSSKSTSNKTLSEQTVYVSYTEDPAELYLVNTVADILSAENNTVVLSSSYAVSDNIRFSTSTFSEAIPLVKWEYPIQILSKPSVSGININHTFWNISFDGAKITQD